MLTDAGFDYVNVEGVFRVRIGAGALSAEQPFARSSRVATTSTSSKMSPG